MNIVSKTDINVCDISSTTLHPYFSVTDNILSILETMKRLFRELFKLIMKEHPL